MNPATLRAHNRTGPSPYAVKVLRALLRGPKRIPQIAAATNLDHRTVQAQITALRESDAIKVVGWERVNFGGSWAVYGANVIHL